MTTRASAFSSLFQDVGITLFLFAHWVLVGFFVDAAGNGEALRIGAAIYLPVVTSIITLFLLWQSYIKVGQKNTAKENPETLLGLWCEVLNVVQSFGLLFNMSRVLALPKENSFHENTFLHNLGDSIYESSMVQFGVGYVAAAPTTLAERAVTFCTAYCGGLLFVNMFLISTIFGRRFWASLPAEKEPMLSQAAAPVQAMMHNWRLDSVVAARA